MWYSGFGKPLGFPRDFPVVVSVLSGIGDLTRIRRAKHDPNKFGWPLATKRATFLCPFWLSFPVSGFPDGRNDGRGASVLSSTAGLSQKMNRHS